MTRRDKRNVYFGFPLVAETDTPHARFARSKEFAAHVAWMRRGKKTNPQPAAKKRVRKEKTA